jgi:hypothetical protein
VARTAPGLSVILAAVSIALVVAVGGLYLGVMYWEGDTPKWWVVIGLLGAIVVGLGTIWRTGPGSVAMGIVGGLILLVMGWLAIFSIGLPLLVAGILMLIVAVMRLRARSVPVTTAR